MAVYCVSDIHGCYEQFMELLQLIKFDSACDTLYVLGDCIDRGTDSLKCLEYIKTTPGIVYLRGNHDQMMVDYYTTRDDSWNHNGNHEVRKSLQALSENYKSELLDFVSVCPLVVSLVVGGRNFVLSHAGIDASVSDSLQYKEALIWSREEFYEYPTHRAYICVFGHTPTLSIRDNMDCSVWVDTVNKDKIGIDCGCVFGGALAALRLDDLEVFYVKSSVGKYVNKVYFGATDVSRDLFGSV